MVYYQDSHWTRMMMGYINDHSWMTLEEGKKKENGKSSGLAHCFRDVQGGSLARKRKAQQVQ